MKTLLALLITLLGVSLSPQLVSAADGDAKIRVLHASPDAPAVDVYANGNKILTNIPFGTLSAYLAVPRGSYKIQVKPTGQETPVVIDTDVYVGRNKFYTFAAVGPLANIELLEFRDRDKAGQNKDPRVRVVHLSPNAPAVDVGVVGQKPFVKHLAFQDKSSYKRLPVGTYTISVRLAGTDTNVLTVPNVTLTKGLSATVYALGFAGGTPPLSAVVAVDGE